MINFNSSGAIPANDASRVCPPGLVPGRNFLAGTVAKDADFINGGHGLLFIKTYITSRILILLDQSDSPVIGKIFA